MVHLTPPPKNEGRQRQWQRQQQQWPFSHPPFSPTPPPPCFAWFHPPTLIAFFPLVSSFDAFTIATHKMMMMTAAATAVTQAPGCSTSSCTPCQRSTLRTLTVQSCHPLWPIDGIIGATVHCPGIVVVSAFHHQAPFVYDNAIATVAVLPSLSFPNVNVETMSRRIGGWVRYVTQLLLSS